MPKKTFEVKINWFGEVHTFFTKADSEDTAFLNATYRLAYLTGCNIMYVRGKVRNSQYDSYKITERK